MHNASVVLMGGKGSNIADITNEPGDPEVFKAGLAVRKASTGALQLADDAVAPLIGVSLGNSLSDAGRTAVARTGNFIPIRLKNAAAAVKKGEVTFTAKGYGTAGNALSITLTDNNVALPTVSVIGNAVTVTMDGAVTTAKQIADAVNANAVASKLMYATVDDGDDDVAQAAATVSSLTGGSNFLVQGAAVKIDDTTGEASTDGDTTAATYISGVLTGVYPDGTECFAAYIALPGGF